MKLLPAVERYERWLGGFMRLRPDDLERKHARMKEGPFMFLRGTFFRWASCWARLAPEEQRAPLVLGVGELHLENFGTWRDGEGRLVWGINDFDEVAHALQPGSDPPGSERVSGHRRGAPDAAAPAGRPRHRRRIRGGTGGRWPPIRPR